MQREFIENVLRDMRGNAAMGRATGRTKEGKLEIKETRWFVYPDDLDKMVAYAERSANGDRRNVYISPIIYGDLRQKKQDGTEGDITRSKENALLAQTIWMDSDSCPPDAFKFFPSMHVQTSKTHGHDYWFLPEPMNAIELSEIGHRITTAHKEQGCDPTGFSANKFLRMPTVNTSYDTQNPFEVTVHVSGEIYDSADILGAYENVIVVEESAGRETFVPVDIPPLEDFPDALELINKIPATEKRLNDLILKRPKEGPDGWRSEHRYALLADLYRFGFNVEEVAAIAWSCPAAEKWRLDGRGIAGLYGEALKVSKEIDIERGNIEADEQEEAKYEEAYEIPLTAKTPTKILDEIETRRFKMGRTDWIFVEYLPYARSKVPAFNKAYHDVNAWTILSTAFGDLVYIPKDGSMMPVNLFVMILGPSSSGKTESTDLMWPVINKIFLNDNPDIGGNHSDSSLIERVIKREGKVSINHTDEADGVIALWKGTGAGAGWATGVQQTITKMYDGKVPQLSRVGKDDLQVRNNAWASVNSHMMGTPEGMLKVLDTGMFRSGLLVRQIWAEGREIKVTEDSMDIKEADDDYKKAYEAMPGFWADRINRTKEKLRRYMPEGQNRLPVKMTDEAKARFKKAKWDMHLQFSKYEEKEIFKPAIIRMYDIIWKTAALCAVSHGSPYISTRHLEVALGMAEEWLDTLVRIAEGIASSSFSQACDSIEKFIASFQGRETEASKIYANRKAEPIYKTDEYLNSLLRQKRIVERVPKTGGTAMRYYKIREEEKKK